MTARRCPPAPDGRRCRSAAPVRPRPRRTPSSSAAASAAWRPRSAWAARGYRVTVLEKLDAARRPRLRVPAGRLHLRRRADHRHRALPVRGAVGAVRPALRRRRHAACRCDPFYRIRFDDGTHFDYGGDAAAMRARDRALSARRTSPATSASSPRPRPSTALGFEELGAMAFDRVGDMVRACPDLVRMRGWRSVYALVAQPRARPEAAHRAFSFHSAADRRQPVQRHLHLQPDPALERRCGVHCAMGGTGALVRGLVGADRAARRPKCAATPRCGDPGRGRPRDRRRARRRRAASRPTSSVATPTPPGPTATWSRRSTGRTGPTGASSAAHYSMSLFVWYFGTQPAATTTCRTTRSCSGRATRAARATSSSARCSPRTSASTCTARPRPTRRWRRPAATPSTCSRRCRTWTAAPTGRRRPRPTAARIEQRLRRHRAARPRGRRSSPRA